MTKSSSRTTLAKAPANGNPSGDDARRAGMKDVTNLIAGSPEDVIGRTRAGFPASALIDLSDFLELPRTRLYEAVGVSRSTMENRIKKKQTLSADEGDKVVRIAKTIARAAEVLGGEDPARQWMSRRIRSIGDVDPVSLLDTQAGYELVMDTLGRIEHGISA